MCIEKKWDRKRERERGKDLLSIKFSITDMKVGCGFVA